MLPALSSGYEYFLPEGYSVPKVEIPSPTPEDHLKFDNLEIVDRGRVSYLIQLDRSPMQWAVAYSPTHQLTNSPTHSQN